MKKLYLFLICWSLLGEACAFKIDIDEEFEPSGGLLFKGTYKKVPTKLLLKLLLTEKKALRQLRKKLAEEVPLLEKEYSSLKERPSTDSRSFLWRGGCVLFIIGGVGYLYYLTVNAYDSPSTL